MIRGRKRKAGARYPSGKLTRAETERETMSTAIDARRRHLGVSLKAARDERLGSAIGRLAFKQVISEVQYQAGLQFAELNHRHAAALGLPIPSPQSMSALLVNAGIFGTPPGEMVIDVIEQLKRRHKEATTALDECDREHRLSPGRRPTWLIYRMVCLDQDIDEKNSADVGNLRVALNALVRVFRL